MHLTSILSLFVLNSLFLNAWPLRVLFYANIFAQTHMDYVDSLMNVLTDRGHTVDFVIIRINDNVIGNRKNNAERVYSLNFPGGSPWNNMSHLADPFKEEEFYYGNFRQWYNIAHQFCELAVNDENLIKFIGSEKYDIAITSKFDYCPIGMVSLFDIPSIVTSNPVPIQPVQAVMEGIPNPPATVAPVFQALDLSSFRNRFWNVMNWAYIHFIQNPEVKRIQEKIIQSQFGTNFSMDEAVSRVALAFVNSNEIMEKPRPLPHKVQYIGGINLKKPKKLSEEMNRLLELRTGRSGNGTVIFSFGTQVKPSVFPRYAVKNFVKVFKKFPGYTFLWKYEVQKGEERLFEEAENVYPLDWLPQTDLLNDPRVVGFISHVGLNSFNEASYAGKPIVAIPLFADQPHNADNGVLRGTTFRLDKTKLSEEQIERALRAILFDTSYLKNSQMLQKMLHEKPWQPKELFINWLEFAAQNPGLHKILELPGYNMGMIKYFCIDVVFYAILSTFIVSYLVWKLMSQFLGNIFEGITMMRKKKVQ